MLSVSFGKSPIETEPVRRCSRCGNEPRATVQAGGGKTLFWLECRVCGKKTADGQVYEEAVLEWNALQSREESPLEPGRPSQGR